MPFAPAIEAIRQQMLRDETIIEVEDLGSGSTHGQLRATTRRVGAIAATSATPPHYCALYAKLVGYFQFKNIVELGTSLGLTSLYLSASHRVRLATFEGSAAIAAIARRNFQAADRSNIQLVEGNINQTLENYLQSAGKVDLAFIDANHTYEATIRYFSWLSRRMTDNGAIIVDDIHQSRDMTKAWHEIKQHHLVYGSVDLFRCGIVFFDAALNRQHYIWSLPGQGI